MRSPVETRAVVEELARRFQSGDRDGAMALVHPDIRIEQPPSLPHGGWWEGHSGMGAMGARFAEYWDRAIVPVSVAGCGSTAVQVTSQTWTAKSTGRAATVDVVELFAFRDGRISEIRVFQQDTHLLLSTLDG